MSKKEQTPAEASKSGLRTGVDKGEASKAVRGAKTETGARLTSKPPCQKCGQVHPKCNGHTRHGPNAGKPCGANPPAGQLTCVKHGGNNPTHRAKGRERLMAMVEPALVELQKIISNPETNDADKLRGIQLVLDRTGFKAGVEVSVGLSQWDETMLAASGIDPATMQQGVIRNLPPDKPKRALPRSSGGGGYDPAGYEDYEQHATDEQARQWADLDAEDGERIERDRIRSEGHVVVQGEVVRNDPPTYDPEATRVTRFERG